MLVVFSPGEDQITVSKAARERSWQAFLKGGTNHSGSAMTLGPIIRRCEREQIAYRLTAWPGHGYYLEPVKKGSL